MRSTALPELALAAAMAVLAAGAVHAGDAAPVSSIRVTGNARVSARPDRAQIDIGVTNQAEHSEQAAADNARQVDKVLAALRPAAGPTAQLKTISYSLSPDYQYHPGGGQPTLTGYTATNVVQVTLDDLGRVGGVVDAATRAGANRVQGIQFTLRDQDAVRAEALREAAVRAHAEAEVLASALGLKVLRVLTVEESSPPLMPVRPVMMAAARAATAEVATPVEQGTLDITADVTLSVEVGPVH
ncbi:MAG: SIMPL domain-containing protein [Steroidobacteraceae bacterium]